jgi:hypothetical protein
MHMHTVSPSPLPTLAAIHVRLSNIVCFSISHFESSLVIIFRAVLGELWV